MKIILQPFDEDVELLKNHEEPTKDLYIRLSYCTDSDIAKGIYIFIEYLGVRYQLNSEMKTLYMGAVTARVLYELREELSYKDGVKELTNKSDVKHVIPKEYKDGNVSVWTT